MSLVATKHPNNVSPQAHKPTVHKVVVTVQFTKWYGMAQLTKSKRPKVVGSPWRKSSVPGPHRTGWKTTEDYTNSAPIVESSA